MKIGSNSLDNMATARRPATSALVDARRPAIFAIVAIVLFHFTWALQGDDGGVWLPGLGLGIALAAWLGWRFLPFLAADLLVLAVFHRLNFLDVFLHAALIGSAWWLYTRVALGSRWLDDPRSATLF